MLHVRNKKRIMRFLSAALVLFGCILSKLGYEQIINQGSIVDKAKDLWQRDFKLAGNPGNDLFK